MHFLTFLAGGYAQNTTIHEPVRLTMCSFWVLYDLSSGFLGMILMLFIIKKHISSLEPSALARHFITILAGEARKNERRARDPFVWRYVRFRCNTATFFGAFLSVLRAHSFKKSPKISFARAFGTRAAFSSSFSDAAGAKRAFCDRVFSTPRSFRLYNSSSTGISGVLVSKLHPGKRIVFLRSRLCHSRCISSPC